MGAEKGGGEKNPAGDGGAAKAVAVFKMDLHCEGCAKKVKRAIKHLDGVENVKADCAANKLTVTGKVDPATIKGRLEEKTKKKVEIVSPQPKKDGGGGGGDKKSDEKKPAEQKKPAEEKKPEEKKPPKESNVVLKIRTHCEGCVSKMKKMIKKIKGVSDVVVDATKDLVTVKGTMDVKDLVSYLKDKLNRDIEVVPSKKEDKKEKESGGGGGDAKKAGGEGSEKKEKEGGGGGDSGGATVGEVSRMEYHGYPAPQPNYWFDGYGQNHVVAPVHYYNYQPPPPQQHQIQGYAMNRGYVNQGYEMDHYNNQAYYVPPHQMFSDENPNACSLM